MGKHWTFWGESWVSLNFSAALVGVSSVLSKRLTVINCRHNSQVREAHALVLLLALASQQWRQQWLVCLLCLIEMAAS